MKSLIFTIWFQVLLTVCFASDSLSIPSIYPSFLTAYDIDQGLPISCVNKIVVDKKGRIWLNPCPIYFEDQEISFYQFDGKNSYEVPIKLLDGSISSDTWFVNGITQNGLIYGSPSNKTQAFFLNPDTHETRVFSFSSKERIINLVANKDHTIFAITRAEGTYSIYELSFYEKTFLTSVNKLEIRRHYVLPTIPTINTNGKIWFLHQNIGFLSVDTVTKVSKEYRWEDLLGHKIPDYLELSTNEEFIKMNVDGKGNLIFYIENKKRFFHFDTQAEELTLHRKLNSQLDKIARFRVTNVNFFSDAQKNLLTEIRYDQSPGTVHVEEDISHLLLDKNDQLFNYNPIISQSREISRFRRDFIRDVNSPDFKKEIIIASGGGLVTADIQADLPIISLLEKWPSRAIVQIDEDLLWVKSDKRKIAKVNMGSRKTSEFLPFEICKSEFNIKAFSKLINKDKKVVWFPTRDGDLYSYQVNEQSCTKFPVGPEFEKFDFINDKEVALVSLEHEVFIYNLEQKKVNPFLQNGNPLNIGKVANDVYCDTNGFIWIPSLNGLWKVDPQSNTATRLGKEQGFTDDQFLCIYEDRKGRLWLGTFNEGIQMYDPKDGSIRIINENDGLSNNSVAGILSDQDGDLWLSTFDGVTVISKEGDVLFELNEKDGISHKEFNRYSYAKTWDEKIIFGGIEGINIFEPQKIKQFYLQKKDLNIYISEIGFFNKKTDSSITLRSGFDQLEEINLPPTHRYLTLDFALSDYMNPEKMTFSYRIEKKKAKKVVEEEDLWISIGANSNLTLTDLPVGKFTLFIKGSNYKGQWTEQPLAIPVKVNPFFYNTWWFYLLCSLPFLIGAYFWYQRLITEKKRLEAEVNKRTLQIVKDKELIEEQAAKLLELDEMKSRFFTNISHEFRTPLTIISGMIPQMENNPDQWMTKGMELIRRNSNHLLSLINQILDLRKLESGALQANFIQSDIIPYLHYIADSFKAVALSKGIKLHILSQKKELVMDYDPDKMMHILSNLLSNALKYTSSEGDIYLQINQNREANIDQLELVVKDTGQGIRKEHLPFIFDRFYQVEDLASQKPQGSGVGLALTRELVQLLNGQIIVESEWGHGTSFTLYFPITHKARFQENQPKLEEINHEEMPVTENTLINGTEEIIAAPITIKSHSSDLDSLPSLLIVEDNPEVRLYLTACLAKDYNLLMAENGQEGIDLAIEKIPDLLVSDVMMPIKNGFELCDTLKNDERTSHIPIILLTAKADFDSKLSGLKKGADAYLTKPFQEEELLVRLEQLLILRNKLHERYKNQLGIDALPSSPNHSMEDAFMQKFHQLVIDHITEENFGVVQLCRLMSISRSQLHKKIKAITGQSTTALVRSIRLNKAKQLLQTTDLNISEVGYEVGINNPAYFSRIYSEEFGEAPRETRK